MCCFPNIKATRNDRTVVVDGVDGTMTGQMKSYTTGQPPLGKYVLAVEDRTIVVDVGHGIFKTSADFYPIEVAYMAGSKFYGPMGKDERVG